MSIQSASSLVVASASAVHEVASNVVNAGMGYILVLLLCIALLFLEMASVSKL